MPHVYCPQKSLKWVKKGHSFNSKAIIGEFPPSVRWPHHQAQLIRGRARGSVHTQRDNMKLRLPSPLQSFHMHKSKFLENIKLQQYNQPSTVASEKVLKSNLTHFATWNQCCKISFPDCFSLYAALSWRMALKNQSGVLVSSAAWRGLASCRNCHGCSTDRQARFSQR